MPKTYTFAELQQHRSPQSCWVVLYGTVYDVTAFLPSHPGGSETILRLAGIDATEDYDPVHPPGTLEENLPAEAKLGPFDASTLPSRPTERGRDAHLTDSNNHVFNGSSSSSSGSISSSSSSSSSSSGIQPPNSPDYTIASLQDCLNLDDIERLATRKLSRKAWAYYYSAGDDLISKRLNNEVYRKILLRPRVFIDCTRCDTSTRVIGNRLSVPFFVSPAAQARLGHADGEHGIARACAKFGAMQLISNNASQTPEQIVADAQPGQVFGWQMYVQTRRSKSEAMLQRVHRLPAVKFVCLTLDAPVPGKREDDERSQSVGAQLPVASGLEERKARSHGGGGVGKTLFAGTASDLTWKTTLPWLAKHTHLPIVLKGIQTHEDAYLASLHAPQVRGVILSNHGGRALDTAPPSIHTLLEIRKYCPDVLDRIEIWVDGGVRRGTDVVKALCLGARAVGIGRPPLFGLGAGGTAGVERVFDILDSEVKTAMRLLGVEKVDELGPHHINARAVEREIFDGVGAESVEGLKAWAKSKL